MLKIRNAILKDIKSITEIYNEAIVNTNATFDTEKKTINEMKEWFKDHDPKNPIIVAEKDNVIVGWGALSKYDDKKAYSNTAELSLYVLKDYQEKGIGKNLMNNLLKEGKKADIHAVIARITEGNDVSIYLHKEFGFKKIGTLKEVGKKFNKILDVHIFEKML